MQESLSEQGLKEAIQNSLIEELRNREKLTSQPDASLPRSKAHEGWIRVSSAVITDRIFKALSENKTTEELKQIGLQKLKEILGVSSFDQELASVISTTLERTLKILLRE